MSKRKRKHERKPFVETVDYTTASGTYRDFIKDISDEGVFIEPAERELFSALCEAESIERFPGSVDDFLNTFLPMIPPIDRFFDDVLVMIDDVTIQENRLGLLQRIAAQASGVADMSRLEGF